MLYVCYICMTKNELIGEDIILNLKEINIINISNFSSSHFSGDVGFHFDCHTDNGFCEDPEMDGIIKVIDVKKDDEGCFNLKVKFEKNND